MEKKSCEDETAYISNPITWFYHRSDEGWRILSLKWNIMCARVSGREHAVCYNDTGSIVMLQSSVVHIGRT